MNFPSGRKCDRLVSGLATELAAKRLEILEEIVPNMSPLGMFWNDTNPSMVLSAHQSQDAAAKLGLTIQCTISLAFDSAFAVVERGRVAALLTLIDPFTREYRQQIVDFAAQRHLPAIYDAREFVQSGGLISYGPSLLAMQQRVADYVDKIFKGAKRFRPGCGNTLRLHAGHPLAPSLRNR